MTTANATGSDSSCCSADHPRGGGALSGRQWLQLAGMATVFLAVFFLPVDSPRFDAAVGESLQLVRWYAREHVLLCLVPAFFIAGAISVFIAQASVLKYLGANAPKPLAYGVASVSGSILAVCSCTVLPLFAGIWKMGAGLGPATAFLYSGPAISVLALILTARVLGLQLGLARAMGAVLFSIGIGLLMHLIYRREERQRCAVAAALPAGPPARPLGQTALALGLMVAILVFANWAAAPDRTGLFAAVHAGKWWLTALSGLGLAAVLVAWFGLSGRKMLVSVLLAGVLALAFPSRPEISFTAAAVALGWMSATGSGEARAWFAASWGFAVQILPLLLAGVLVAGLLLGRPGHEGLLPSAWIARSVGGNSLYANGFASVVGAFMYFATLTEVPILQGLLGSGMGQGPALALLLAGPALSLPSMLVLRGILGTGKTIVYVLLVVGAATICGLVYGTLAA